jgi:hypothetical protein
MEIMTTGSWKASSEKLNGVANPIDACQNDDFITFASNGTYTYNIGTTTCYDGEESYDGTWALSADEKTITVDGFDAGIVVSENQIVITLVDGSDTIERTFIPK